MIPTSTEILILSAGRCSRGRAALAEEPHGLAPREQRYRCEAYRPKVGARPGVEARPTRVAG